MPPQKASEEIASGAISSLPAAQRIAADDDRQMATKVEIFNQLR